MNFKLSDLIWTVILFGLFILVVNGLLIKPMLKFMDARRERIDRARAMKLEREENEKLAAAEGARLAEETERLRREEERKALLKASEEAKEELRLFQAELASREKEAAAGLEALSAETDEKLLSEMDGMIEAFTNKLIPTGQG
ncbi:MAG: hypothetical protein K6G56_05440 [Clostridiales bacterium]|nr:hypothetical protein [Clostridiales bacterium]